MKRIFLFYPPGALFQRGEDRCQSNISGSTATSMRAANDLGYAAAGLMEEGFDVKIKDFQTENCTLEDLENTFKEYNPDVIFVSITNTTIFDDLKVIKRLKEIKPELVVLIKGAIFFNASDDVLNQLDLSDIDYLIGGESEFITADLIKAHFESPEKIPAIRGILYRKEEKWEKTDFSSWEEDLDKLPFPARSIMNNHLYLRPDTGEPQATIATSRGCPSACIYCETPRISGKKLRMRSPDNILAELKECYSKHNIRNFFFKSDTFTFNKDWVAEVCTKIIDSELNGKISWVANSRVKPLEEETLHLMKKAGCWLVAFGYESGSPETLKKIKKGATVEDNIRASKLVKKAGLKSYGFFLVGLPWEDKSHLEETKKHIFELDSDFIELHVAIPFYGTELYRIAKEEKLINDTILGKDYFNVSIAGTKHLGIDEIEEFRKKTLMQYHLRPVFIIRKLLDAALKPKVLLNYFRYGTKMIAQNLFK